MIEMRYQSWKPSEVKRLESLVREGLNVAAIALLLGRTHEAVKARARLLGLPLKTIVGRPQLRA